MNERLEKIYEVALVTLSEKGYHGTSMRDIASAVGIRTPSLYHYFDGKQDLLFRLMGFVMKDLTARTEAAAAPHPGDPLKALQAAIEAFVLFNASHPHGASVSDAGFGILNDEQQQATIALRDRFDAIYSRLLVEGVSKGIFDDCDVSVVKNTIISACARVHIWYRPGGSASPEEVARTVSQLLTMGIVKRPQHAVQRRQSQRSTKRTPA